MTLKVLVLCYVLDVFIIDSDVLVEELEVSKNLGHDLYCLDSCHLFVGGIYDLFALYYYQIILVEIV